MATTLGAEREQAILDLLWDYLKQDSEHRDRKKTGWGTKTKVGLCACLAEIVSPIGGPYDVPK